MTPKIRPSWLVGITTVGNAWLTTADPSAIRFPQVNADNTVSYLTDLQFRIAIGAGTGGGDITGNTGPVDNRLIRSFGTSGKEISSSAITVDDSGNLTTAGSIQGLISIYPPANLGPGSIFQITNPTGNDLQVIYTTGSVVRVSIPDSGTIELNDFVSVDGLESSDDISTLGVVQTGLTSTLSYNRFGTGTTSHALNGPEDIFVTGDAEVNGTLYADGPFRGDGSNFILTSPGGFSSQVILSANAGGTIWTVSATQSNQNFELINTTSQVNFAVSQAGSIILQKTITPTGTTGARTINKPAGSVNFAIGATTLVVTNSLVTSSSVILLTVASDDVTFKSASYIPNSGSFTITANTAPTAETRIDFLVIN